MPIDPAQIALAWYHKGLGPLRLSKPQTPADPYAPRLADPDPLGLRVQRPGRQMLTHGRRPAQRQMAPQPELEICVQVVQHGACLGLGIAGLGSNNAEIFEEIKGVLYTDGAISGEAAGLALGLLSCGSGTDKVEELLAYAHDTQHEKVSTELALFMGSRP